MRPRSIDVPGFAPPSRREIGDYTPASLDPLRVQRLDEGARVNSDGRYVLYWTQIFRRPRHNHALNYAVERANDLGLPVVVYEGLRHDYPWASDRIHVFILEGARQSARELARRRIPHVFFLQRNSREHRKAVAHLGRDAALVVTDLYPSFIIPGQTAKAVVQVRVPFYAVDSCGVVPIRAFEKEEYAARTLRPKITALLGDHLKEIRDPRPEHQSRDPGIAFPWSNDLEASDPAELAASCSIDHSVPPVPSIPGGWRAAEATLRRFIDEALPRYADDRNHPDREAVSGLSPYLHFGHIAATDCALAAKRRKGVDEKHRKVFLEELIVRRELSYNFALRNPEHRSLEALPDWVRRNLSEHAGDERPRIYSPDELERAETHDEVWNAAQRQLLREGRIHNYLRMVWGKKVIEWTRSYAEAFEVLVHLNNKYALDGRDPNSWTGILWCFGKHDRAWQTTPVLGKIRPMSTANTRRKVRMEEYLRRFGPGVK
jgi:deoxyribodipyrimidine photo-lyase